MAVELNLKTRDGQTIPMMEREEALKQGLIPPYKRQTVSQRTKYDKLHTLLANPYHLPQEREWLVNACTDCASHNRVYLVVYRRRVEGERYDAWIYQSTSARETAQLAQEESKDINHLFTDTVADVNGLSIQSEEELTKLAG